MEQRAINSQLNVTLAAAEIGKKFIEGGWWLKFYKPSEKRKDKQNALSFLIYDHVSNVQKQETIDGVRCFCKYTFGVSILIADDLEMMNYFKLVFEKHSYEKRLEIIKHLPVTSLMSVKQFARYLDNVYKHYDGQGLQCPRPDDLYLAAMGIKK